MDLRRLSKRRGPRSAVTLLLAIALGSALAPAAFAQAPWPYDGQNALAFRTSSDAPRDFGNLRQAWSRSFDSDVTGTPVVADNGGVYVGTHAGEVHGLRFDNGQSTWATGGAWVGGPVVGSVLFANKTVYAAASDRGKPKLVALEPLAGDRKFSTVLDSQHGADVWGSPTYSPERNLVYVPICACEATRDGEFVRTRGALVAVDATTGAVVWKSFTVPEGMNGGGIAGTPVVADFADRVFVATDGPFFGAAHPNTNAILAYDSATGELVGRFTAAAGFRTNPLAFQDGPVSRIGAGAENGVFYAVDLLTMDLGWERQVGRRIDTASAWDNRRPSTSSKVYGVAQEPTLFWSLRTNGGGGPLEWTFPGTPVEHGPVSFSKGYVWVTDASGFLNLQSDHSDGRPLVRSKKFLGKPSIGGVSFGRRQAYVATGTGRDTGGGVVAFK